MKSWLNKFDDAIIEKVAASLSVSLSTDSTTGLNTQASMPTSNTGIPNQRSGSNLNNTLSKARTNTDLEPLHKDSGIISKPMDMATQITSRQQNQSLSHLIDGRIKRNRLIKMPHRY